MYFKSSRPEVLCKKIVLKNFAKFLLSNKVAGQPAALLKRDFDTGAILSILQIFKNTFSQKTPHPGDCHWHLSFIYTFSIEKYVDKLFKVDLSLFNKLCNHWSVKDIRYWNTDPILITNPLQVQAD